MRYHNDLELKIINKGSTFITIMEYLYCMITSHCHDYDHLYNLMFILRCNYIKFHYYTKICIKIFLPFYCRQSNIECGIQSFI